MVLVDAVAADERQKLVQRRDVVFDDIEELGVPEQRIDRQQYLGLRSRSGFRYQQGERVGQELQGELERFAGRELVQFYQKIVVIEVHQRNVVLEIRAVGISIVDHQTRRHSPVLKVLTQLFDCGCVVTLS